MSILPYFENFKFTVLLFAITTTVTVYSYMEPDRVALEVTVDSASQKIFVPNKLSRQVASVPSDNSENITLSEDFFCNRGQRVTSYKANRMAQLSFRLCGVYLNAASIGVKNSRNGFNAHIFKANHMNFNTDYIQLEDGSNSVEIEFILKNGQIYRETLLIESRS